MVGMQTSVYGVTVDGVLTWCYPGHSAFYLPVFDLMNWIQDITGGSLCKSGPRPGYVPPTRRLYVYALIACLVVTAVVVVGFVRYGPRFTRSRRRRKHRPTIWWISAPRSSRSPRIVQPPAQPAKIESPNKFKIQINVFNKDGKKRTKR